MSEISHCEVCDHAVQPDERFCSKCVAETLELAKLQEQFEFVQKQFVRAGLSLQETLHGNMHVLVGAKLDVDRYVAANAKAAQEIADLRALLPYLTHKPDCRGYGVDPVWPYPRCNCGLTDRMRKLNLLRKSFST